MDFRGKTIKGFKSLTRSYALGISGILGIWWLVWEAPRRVEVFILLSRSGVLNDPHENITVIIIIRFILQCVLQCCNRFVYTTCRYIFHLTMGRIGFPTIRAVATGLLRGIALSVRLSITTTTTRALVHLSEDYFNKGTHASENYNRLVVVISHYDKIRHYFCISTHSQCTDQGYTL